MPMNEIREAAQYAIMGFFAVLSLVGLALTVVGGKSK